MNLLLQYLGDGRNGSRVSLTGDDVIVDIDLTGDMYGMMVPRMMSEHLVGLVELEVLTNDEAKVVVERVAHNLSVCHSRYGEGVPEVMDMLPKIREHYPNAVDGNMVRFEEISDGKLLSRIDEDGYLKDIHL